MNRNDLIYEVAKQMPLPRKDVEAIIKATFAEIGKQLIRGEQVQIKHFGTFKLAERIARKGVNPRTGEVINLPASKRIVFAQGKELKRAVNGA